MCESRKPKLPNYDSPSELKSFLDFSGLGMQKKFGQNFLTDRNTRNALLSFLKIKEGTRVWEVGAGLGAMTELLLQRGANLTAFEIDKGFSKLLKFFFTGQNKFRLVEGDVQKTWKLEIKEKGKPEIFFGNLPYNIALDLISSIIEQEVIFDSMLITVQKEAAERIIAKPGNKNYTVLSVLCSIFYECKIVKTIPASSFWPKPNVESAAVLFTPKKEFPAGRDFIFFVKTVKALFSSRRKTVKNNLSAWLKSNGFTCTAEEVLKTCGLNENLRAENLSLYDFLSLSNIIAKTRTEGFAKAEY
ncbi:16S rRNA (adenine(1518)-N(6)/adenine(1519)-N(6))-dimethyltransferase RsmA [Treponema pedis]|uniref:16S rRNA (adenine(1518)-N(6)/adenine(1519)-N(6))- dimethyltransferase RsmA n=1 Tax=Treponema pedis TaxID=409322 RepID=UPI00198108FB|nr:16S rRNA (adenine(1518)-N(6)/adenine(1519)-N(6))-dimethyltransferase RsmA [Treponema pedis]QSI04861.1 ribosomal RNA small subunit methyltransferase A [Treponema pedis]